MKKFQLEHYILVGIGGFLLALAITTDYHRVVDYLFSDEAVYYAMAQSLAFDRDMEYTRQDLQRVYEEGWYAGPQGIYLTKAADGRIYYGKYLTYSLFLAPFIAIFGLKGFLILNVLLLFLIIWMGWLYLRQFNPQNTSLLVSLTFFLLSASFVYTFWITPETFNMFCVTFGLFLWLYKREDLLNEGATYRQMLSKARTPHKIRNSQYPIRSNLLSVKYLFTLLGKAYIHIITLIKWLLKSPDGRLYLAPIPIAIACASKITNLLFLLPILIEVVLKGYAQRYNNQDTRSPFTARLLQFIVRIMVLGVIFGIVAGIFFGLQYVLTGNYNQYTGDRRMFIRNFPFNAPNDVWNQGLQHTNDMYWTESFFLTPKTLFYNIYYYLFGRFTGMFPYFICSFLALYFFVRRALVRTISPLRKIELWRRLVLLLAIVSHIMAYIVMAPINYHGGSGAFGNRFFLNIYPAFFFLITMIAKRSKETRIPVALVITWIIGSLFLAQALLNPFQSSYYPAAHAFKFPYRFLPVELTMINAIPTHVNPHLMQAVDNETPPYRLYFLDENVADMDSREFWVQGEKTSEFVILTAEPQSHLVLTITNGPIANQVDISVSGITQSIRFTAPNEKKRLVFPLNWSMPYFNASLYPVKIRSHTGFIPKFTSGIALPDLRYLGCRVSLSLNPLEAGKVYLEHNQPQEALTVLEPAVQEYPDDIQSRYYLGIAYQQAELHEAALRELEHSQSLLPDFQITNIYEAEELFHKTGKIVDQPTASNGKVVLFQPGEDPPGFIVYGPYTEFPPGQYQARYRMNVGERIDDQASRNGAALFFDVYSQKYGTFLKRDRVLLEKDEDLEEYREYTLNFEIAYPTILEFRVETTGYAEVAVDRIDVYPHLPLQIYQALARSMSSMGAYEDAHRYLQKVVAIDPWTPELQIEFLQVLLKSKQWENVLQIAAHRDNFSHSHTGIVTYLDPQLSNLPFDLPESIEQFYEEVYAGFSPENPLAHNFDDKLAFIGYDLPTDTLSPGEHFAIRYYWRALQPMHESYAIFVHFVKKEKFFASETTSRIKRKVGIQITDMFQQDHQPVHGAYPTSKWLANELICEQYEVMVPPEIESGVYEIWIGVWNPFTQKRLKTDGKTKVNIGEIRVIDD